MVHLPCTRMNTMSAVVGSVLTDPNQLSGPYKSLKQIWRVGEFCGNVIRFEYCSDLVARWISVSSYLVLRLELVVELVGRTELVELVAPDCGFCALRP
ncbi:hypothetical protein F511_29155 [Dorcoceras hygrometricum]|uniref:Uncharacterized protein n=1 Tax=Dorcoceras hygrometricum TaxID=472368 RepID=A0A2Z7BJL4_9LAMI|nr:hypothetical protein F511_29155 [Dorcoceras hygrometricum]